MTLPNLITGNTGAQQPYTPVAASAAGAAQQNATSLPAVAGKTTYITGFDVTGGGATAASIIEITVTGLATSAGGTLKFEMNVAAGVTASVNAQGGLTVTFPDPLPASAPNTQITVTVPSFGAGNTNADVSVYGIQAAN